MADILKNFKVNGVEHTLDYETGLSNKPTIPTTVEELSDSGNYVKLENGLVPNNVLPSYVDDVIECANFSSFPATGEVGKIYVDIETNFTYRWSGSTYIQIGGKDTADLEIALENLESEINELQENQFSGSYNDLTDKPTIPTKNSWNYDDRYVKYNVTQSLTETQKGTARANIGAGTSNFSGSYEDLRDKPTIPTQTSQLTNNSDFITNSALTPYALNSNLTSEVNRLDARINAITGGGEGDDVPTLDNVYTQKQVNDLLANKVDKTITVNGHALSSNVTVTKSDVSLGNVTNDAQVKRSEMGVASGVATLGTDGKVPSAQLPSYVDDVLEYASKSVFPTSGESGKIYIDTSNNKTYRWSGSTYVEISSSLALGETSSTAYAGNKGATNASNITKIINGTTTVGKATQATKVGTDTIGDTNTPIYLNAGVPTKLGFTIAKSVPSDAKFTDTTYSTATSSTAGLVKIGYSASGKNYAVQLNSAGQMYVNVPWENTQGTDTGATSVTTTGSGNAVTSASYDSSTRKLTLTKDVTFLTSHQSLANYVTLDGNQTITGIKTFSTHIKTAENTMGIKLRTHDNYETGWVYGTSGNEAITLAIQNPVTAFQIVYGTKPSAFAGNTWQDVTPLFQTKDGKVIINRKITATTDTTSLKLLDVNGEMGATTFTEGELLLTRKYGTLLPFGTQIGTNVNLNTVTYIKVGNYFCSANTTVVTLTNCPTKDAFMMQVYSPLATSFDNESSSMWVYRLRKLLTYTGDEYIQQVYSGATAGTFTYGPWKKIAKTEDLSSYAKKAQGVYYVEGNTTGTAGTWTGSNSDITSYYDGLVVNYKIGIAGASTTTLNINSLGAKTCYLRGTTAMTTQYAVGTMVLLSYNATTGAFYSADYDANSYVTQTVRTTNGNFPLLLRGASAGTTTATTTTSFGTKMTANPSTGAISATSFIEDGTTLSNKYLALSGGQLKSLKAPISSGSTTFDFGEAGQVLTSNGSTVYWSTPSSSSSTSQYITIDTNKVVIGADSTASTYGTAVGDNATASGSYATAIGRLTEATGSHSIAIGTAYSYGNYGIAIGESETYVTSGVHGGIAIGEYAQVSGNMSIAIGSMGSDGESDYECVASKPYTISIGNGSRAKGDYGISIGRLSDVKGNYGIALGNLSSVTNAGGIAIGNGTSATYGVSLGNRAKSSGSYSVAIGTDASALGNYSIAIGYNVSVPAGNAIIKIGGATYNSYYYSGTSTSWTSSSDIRDKINITDMPNCQKIIDAINPIYYNYNRRRDYSENSSLLDYNIDEHIKGTKAEERITLGFRAQDVAKVMKELYGDECFGNIVVHDYEKDEETGKENDAYFMNNGELIPILVGALKEQKVIIDNLMERIKKIEEKSNIE